MSPIRIVDVDLDRPVEAIRPTREAERDYVSARVIVWHQGRPLGHFDLPLSDGALPANQLDELVHREFRQPPITAPEPPIDAGLVSVIVATVSRPERLRKTISDILTGTYREVELVVVDNSEAGKNAAIVAAFTERDSRVGYVHEPRRGSSMARNSGLRHTEGRIVAFTDDDVIVSPHWVERLVAAFACDPKAACVTGLILPAELETAAQIWFADGTGFGKGYEPAVFEFASRMPALFPFRLGAYGSGANFAATRTALEAIGGFDPVLGGGTATRGGEDIDLFLRLIQQGLRLRYEPGAVVMHTDHRRFDDLLAQQYSYGIGLAAVLSKHFLTGQHRRMLRIAPKGIAFLLSRHSPKNAGKPKGYPRLLDLAELAGICQGPRAYLQSRRRSTRER